MVFRYLPGQSTAHGESADRQVENSAKGEGVVAQAAAAAPAAVEAGEGRDWRRGARCEESALSRGPAPAAGHPKGTGLAEPSEVELGEVLPGGVTPVINLVQLLVQNCAGNYCEIDQGISNRKVALRNSKHLLPSVMRSLSMEII